MAAKSVRQAKVPLPADVQIGARIKHRRIVLSMSQSDLGNAVGVTFQQVQKYERGMNRVGGSRLAQVATVLNCPVSYFFEGVENTPADDTMEETIPQLDRATLGLLKAYQKLPSRLQAKVRALVASMANVTDDEDEVA
jgi:transcriptional regulator with XRE-family HTH domain